MRFGNHEVTKNTKRFREFLEPLYLLVRFRLVSATLIVMDLKNPKLIYLKAGLFLLAGCLSGGMLLWEHASLRLATLLVICVWCFARAYYFAFYVVERYVDASFRFAGLGSFVAYLIRQRRSRVNWGLR